MSESSISRVLWRTDHWMHCYQNYSELVSVFINNLSLPLSIGSLLDSSEYESFGGVAISILHRCNRSLPFLALLIESELKKTSESVRCSAFRGNDLVSAAEKRFVKMVAKDYLAAVIGDLVRKIIDDRSLNLEVDASKITDPAPYATVEEAVQAHAIEAQNKGAELINRIISAEAIAMIPPALAELIGILAAAASKYLPGMTSQLINGFVILRLFSPALVAPESVGIVPPELPPGPQAHRNLVILAKLIQTIANKGVAVGKKEEYMNIFSAFVTEEVSVVNNYFDSLASSFIHLAEPHFAVADSPDNLPDTGLDPRKLKLSDMFELHRILYCVAGKLLPIIKGSVQETQPTGINTISLEEAQARARSASGQDFDTPTISPASSLSPSSTPPPSSPTGNSPNPPSSPRQWKPVTPNVQSGAVTVGAPPAAGGGFHAAKPMGMVSGSGSGTRTEFARATTRKNSWQVTIMELLMKIGPPPVFSKTSTKASSFDDGMTLDASSVAASAPRSSEPSSGPQSEMSQMRFLYQGPTSLKTGAIFYLVVSRLTPELLKDVRKLMPYITKTMDPGVHAGSYSLVVDMSWVNLSRGVVSPALSALGDFVSMFGRSYRKNMKTLVILHPNKLSEEVLELLKTFTSKKFSEKIRTVDEWRDIGPILGLAPEDIAIPESAKHNVSKVYNVVKVNSAGKKQDRIIKFTADSLLNLDPRGSKIHNEKHLSELEELSIPDLSSPEIFMRFQTASDAGNSAALANADGTPAPAPQAPKKRGLFSAFTRSGSRENFRTYICSSITERDAILLDLFASGFRCGYAAGKQEFEVVKVNKVGKQQKRVFKLTTDSLMNVDGDEIKHEMPFAGIEGVYPDPNNPDTVWLKYKAEEERRQILVGTQAGAFIKALQDGLARYQTDLEE